jgi:YbbR domain-containing protein
MLTRFLGRWRLLITPLALGLTSLLAALALWVAVTEAQNPSRDGFFNGAIEIKAVNVPDGLAVASIREHNVTLKISAPENTFKKLTTADFAAEVDLSGVRASSSDQRVVGRVVGRRDIEIIEVTPPVVTVSLEAVSTRTVPVQASLQGTPPQGFSLGDIEMSPTQVRITGADSLVKLVNSVSADVNLTGLRTAIRQQYTLVPRDARGADVRGVVIDPGTADLKVNILQQEVTLTLTVLPSVQGSVADGYNLASVAPDPVAISVSGPLDLLQALPSVSTETVDISGLRGDATKAGVRLRVPAGLQASRDSVTVKLHVVPATGRMAFAVAPNVIGVEGNLKVTSVQATSVTVTLAGDVPVLRALQPGVLRANISAAGLAEGVHSLAVTATSPSEAIQVVSVDPSQVVITLSR